MNTVEQLLSEEIQLPSPPVIAVRILEIVRKEDFSFKQLGSVIQSDPALLARILRLANSGFYGLPKKISNIDMAVTVLGVNTLKNIALSFIISEAFSGVADRHVDFDCFWRQSITAAVAGEMIAVAVGHKNDDTFITNLLQNIGVIASIVCRKEDYCRVLEERAVSDKPLIAIEHLVLGYDHQQFGAEMLRKWGLPESVYLPIRHHHNPASAPGQLKLSCTIMQAADHISSVYYGTNRVEGLRNAKALLLAAFSMDDARASHLIDAVAEKSTELQAQFELTPDQIKPFSQILQEANQELSRLNFSYELLVVENREAKERAESLASDLRVANERLRDLAYRDGLTDLYNHRHFLEALEIEMARAERHQRPFSLIMFDVDHFKDVNDSHGHQCGDIVLKAVGQILKADNRKTDMVARYGGEEFVMILPETGLDGALVKAEACRSLVERTAIRALDKVVYTTISGGVAVWTPKYCGNKYKLLEAADQALYRSRMPAGTGSRRSRQRLTGKASLTLREPDQYNRRLSLYEEDRLCTP